MKHEPNIIAETDVVIPDGDWSGVRPVEPPKPSPKLREWLHSLDWFTRRYNYTQERRQQEILLQERKMARALAKERERAIQESIQRDLEILQQMVQAQAVAVQRQCDCSAHRSVFISGQMYSRPVGMFGI